MERNCILARVECVCACVCARLCVWAPRKQTYLVIYHQYFTCSSRFFASHAAKQSCRFCFRSPAAATLNLRRNVWAAHRVKHLRARIKQNSRTLKIRNNKEKKLLLEILQQIWSRWDWLNLCFFSTKSKPDFAFCLEQIKAATKTKRKIILKYNYFKINDLRAVLFKLKKAEMCSFRSEATVRRNLISQTLRPGPGGWSQDRHLPPAFGSSTCTSPHPPHLSPLSVSLSHSRVSPTTLRLKTPPHCLCSQRACRCYGAFCTSHTGWNWIPNLFTGNLHRTKTLIGRKQHS